jgi:hypothetical protein
MGLADTYVQPTNRIPDLFQKIRDGQAPERFTQQLLKDWGFTSTADRAFIPMLKALGFLSAEGKPTQRYNDYRDHSRSKVVMADALRDAYADIFLIKEHPTAGDKEAIEGKFKSFHNASENVAKLMAKTFLSLLSLADLKSPRAPSIIPTATQHWLKQRMEELEKARNFIAHNRMLLPSEFQRIYMYIADWNRVIGL